MYACRVPLRPIGVRDDEASYRLLRPGMDSRRCSVAAPCPVQQNLYPRLCVLAPIFVRALTHFTAASRPRYRHSYIFHMWSRSWTCARRR